MWHVQLLLPLSYTDTANDPPVAYRGYYVYKTKSLTDARRFAGNECLSVKAKGAIFQVCKPSTSSIDSEFSVRQ